MIKLKNLLMGSALVALLVAPSMANAELQKVEIYSHPTFFTSQSQTTAGVFSDSAYIVGGKFSEKCRKTLGIEGKENVLVAGWSESVLNLLKQKQGESFNEKLPVLRSELAVILSEAFSLPYNKDYRPVYKDITNDYWAKAWIDKALDSGIMIGYPSEVFKPDQPVTKAEVFATLATIIDVKVSNPEAIPSLDGETMQYIPAWARCATNEIIQSGLLNNAVDKKNVICDEYLSKKQVAYLLGELRANIYYYKNIKVDKNACSCIKECSTNAIEVKMQDRVSAKHSNVGERFRAKTLNEVTINGVCFPQDSTVVGEVVGVQRPGLKNEGFVKVKFLYIENEDKKANLPEVVKKSTANETSSTNVVGRVLSAPFTAAARVAGIAGRYVGGVANVAGNRTEEFGDYLAGTFAEAAELEPISSVKSFGNCFIVVGKTLVDLVSLTASGVFGALYEIGDEVVYLFAPGLTNTSTLNPDEVITILF